MGSRVVASEDKGADRPVAMIVTPLLQASLPAEAGFKGLKGANTLFSSFSFFFPFSPFQKPDTKDGNIQKQQLTENALESDHPPWWKGACLSKGRGKTG